MVHVEESALRGGVGRSGLPIETVRRLACHNDLVVLVEDRNGEPLTVGRKTRVVPAAIRRALWARDRGCRFPGCGRKRFVEPHHIVHWANGGETSLDNLILLCSAHHAAVHEGGFRLEKDYRDRGFFRPPDGRAVPACGYRPEDVTDDGCEGAAASSAGASSAGVPLATRSSAEVSASQLPSREGFSAAESAAEASPRFPAQTRHRESRPSPR